LNAPSSPVLCNGTPKTGSSDTATRPSLLTVAAELLDGVATATVIKAELYGLLAAPALMGAGWMFRLRKDRYQTPRAF
jgi:hypothetical protein